MNNPTPKKIKPNYDIDKIQSSWLEIGQTENEEWGVDTIFAKKTKEGWVYVQIYYRYGNGSIGWILKDGVLYV